MILIVKCDRCQSEVEGREYALLETPQGRIELCGKCYAAFNGKFLTRGCPHKHRVDTTNMDTEEGFREFSCEDCGGDFKLQESECDAAQ